VGKIDVKRLIDILDRDGRRSFVDIAREFGVSEAAVRKKVKKLVEEGIIKRFTVEVDPRGIGYSVVACIGVDTEPEKLVSAISLLKEDSRVRRLYASAGDHMLMLFSWFRRHGDMEEFVKELESMEGVVKVCPAIILERIK